MYKRLLLPFAILVLSISCNRKDEDSVKPSPDYIVFGHFYGFCIGEECIEIYKLTNDGLYEDTSDSYPRWDRYDEGKWVKLDQGIFEEVKSLVDHIPQQLLSSDGAVFGSPDAADGGGIYFAIVENGETKQWLIDQMEQNIPVYLRPFKDQINSSISMIND